MCRAKKVIINKKVHSNHCVGFPCLEGLVVGELGPSRVAKADGVQHVARVDGEGCLYTRTDVGDVPEVAIQEKRQG